MSRLETARRALRHRNDEVVFTEQWHAQVIAVVELLVAEGKIEPDAWSQTLGAELGRQDLKDASDTDVNYYEAFLSALLQTLEKSRIATLAEVNKRENDWREAYLSTPHGNPVTLMN